MCAFPSCESLYSLLGRGLVELCGVYCVKDGFEVFLERCGMWFAWLCPLAFEVVAIRIDPHKACFTILNILGVERHCGMWSPFHSYRGH